MHKKTDKNYENKNTLTIVCAFAKVFIDDYYITGGVHYACIIERIDG